jgi:hypothetical protein
MEVAKMDLAVRLDWMFADAALITLPTVMFVPTTAFAAVKPVPTLMLVARTDATLRFDEHKMLGIVAWVPTLRFVARIEAARKLDDTVIDPQEMFVPRIDAMLAVPPTRLVMLPAFTAPDQLPAVWIVVVHPYTSVACQA